MSLSWGLFENQWLLATALVCILLFSAALCCIWACKRLKQHKVRAGLVVLANTAFFVSVLGLALDIQIAVNSTQTTYLVTAGADEDALSQLPKGATVYVIGDLESKLIEQFEKVTTPQLSSLNQLFSLVPEITTLHIVGSGLSQQQWQDATQLMGEKLDSVKIEFSPTEPKLGLVDMSWQKEAVVGEMINISGRLLGPKSHSDNIYTLQLVNPIGEEASSVRLKQGETFSFSIAAKSIGKWRYHLRLTPANQALTLANELVAFNVQPHKEIRLLIKQAAPSFETRQLKNWASELGAKVSVLTQISKNKDIRQNINFSATELAALAEPFSEPSLLSFDLLVIDGRSLMTLSAEHKQRVRQAVNSGLGLYVMVDQQLTDVWPVAELSWLGENSIVPLNTDNHFAIPVWPYSNIEEPIPLTKAQLLSTISEALVSSQRQQTLVSRQPLGLGQIALSIINSSYAWKTAGKTGEYAHFWQSILSEVSRPSPPPYWLPPAENTIQRVKQRYTGCIIAAPNLTQREPHWLAEDLPLVALQDNLQPEKYCVTSWLDSAGWQRFSFSDDELRGPSIESHIYVYSPADWQAWRHINNISATQNMLNNKQQFIQNNSMKKPMNKMTFWWALVILGGILWLERKLFSD